MMKRILIVDDENDIGILVTALLHSAGYQAQHVNNANSATEHLRLNKYYGVLLDLNLGSSHGLDLVPDIRRHQPEAIVVVISAHTDESVQQAVYAKGVRKFIKKPFSKAQLLKALE